MEWILTTFQQNLTSDKKTLKHTLIEVLFRGSMFTKELTQSKPIEPVLSAQPLLSGHLPIPPGWPLNRGSTVFKTSNQSRQVSKNFFSQNTLFLQS